MKEPTSPKVAKQVDAKTQELMAEFHAYRDGVIAENPGDPKLTDERLIFESWAIQKIAGLQCVVLDLVEKNKHLRRGK